MESEESEQLKTFIQEVANWDHSYIGTNLKLKAKELLNKSSNMGITIHLVNKKLQEGFQDNERILKIFDKGYFWSVILYHAGIYYEPPIYWRAHWINFEDHEVNIRISKTDFEFYFCADEIGISK